VYKPQACVDLPIPGPPKKLIILLFISINITKKRENYKLSLCRLTLNVPQHSKINKQKIKKTLKNSMSICHV
jgi:hypothetical protein